MKSISTLTMKSIITLLFLSSFVVAPPPPPRAPTLPLQVDSAMAATGKLMTDKAMSNLIKHAKLAQADPANAQTHKANMLKEGEPFDQGAKDVHWIKEHYGTQPRKN
jgi:hypothetical protein